LKRSRSKAAAVAARPGRLDGDLRVEGAVVEEAGERVAARALGELAGDALDVGDEAAVERLARLRLAVALEHPAEDEQLGGDLGRGEPEALALAGEVGGERARILILAESCDEGREGAELAEPAQQRERGSRARLERLVHALDGEVPGGGPDEPGHVAQGREGVG
jgi:hypothetical protein